MLTNRRRFVQGLVMGAAAAATAESQSTSSNTDSRNNPYDNYRSFKFELKGQVATIRLIDLATPIPQGQERPNIHWELADLFTQLRGDNRVRIVVITGPGNGIFLSNPRARYNGPQPPRSRQYRWLTYGGIPRLHQEMAENEKIIVAKVNGDAMSLGQSIVFSSDLIVAKEDAVFADVHLNMGENTKSGPADYGIVPGDGGCALLPLFMSPAKAKECLFLAKPHTGAELAKMGIINYAVPETQLDATVDDLVARLLKRPAHSLAWAKRVANRRVVHHLNMTLYAAVAYEEVGQFQEEAWGHRDGLDKTFL